MLRLRLDTTYLDLSPGTALTLTVHNPLFDQDGAESLYSFPFTLPATPRNLETLSHANRLDNSGNTTTYTGAVLEVDGVPFDHGVLELDNQKFTADGIGAVYRNAVTELFEQLEKIKIDEILETVDASGSAPEAVWLFEQTAVAPALFEISFGGEQFSFNPPGGTLPSAIAEELSNQINAEFPGVAIWVPGQESIRITATDIDELGFDLIQFTNMAIQSFLTDGQQSQVKLQNFLAGISVTPDARIAFPYLLWPTFYAGAVSNFFNRINPSTDGIFYDNEGTESKNDWLVSYVPFVRLPYILEKIAEQVPDYLTTYHGWILEDDPQALIIFNNRSLDLTYENRFEDGNMKFINGFNRSIDLNRHVPGLTAAELLRSLLDFFALWVRRTGTSLEFKKKRDQLSQQPIDWTLYAEPAFQATRRRRRGFSLEYPDIRKEDASFYEDDGQLNDYTSGEAFKTLTLPAGTAKISTTVAATPGTGTLTCPRLDQPGSSAEAGLGNNEYSLRFLFDRGRQSTTSGSKYVMATHGNTAPLGVAAGDLSLELTAADGLYHLHHKGIPELIADGQPLTLPMRLGIHDILNARQWTNARRTIKLEDGHVTAVIKYIQFRASAQGIGISIVEFVQEK